MAHAQNDLNLRLLRMFEGTSLLEEAQIMPYMSNHLCNIPVKFD